MTKRAVVVGIDDYSIQGINSLAMCVRDARAFYHMLIDAFDFLPGNILCYLDTAASSERILQALRWCVTQSQPGDVICFYYSGHGSRLPHPRQVGRAYEVIIPAAGRWISDHELFLIADQLQPSFVNFTCVFDSCHSGGLSLEAEAKSPPMEQTLIDRLVQGITTLIPCGLLLAPEDRVVCENNITGMRLEDGVLDLDPAPNFTTIDKAKTTLISGCAPNELSWEGPQTSAVRNGLLTKSILDIVNQSSFRIDHRSLVDDARARVAAYVNQLFPGEGIVQTPQLIGQDNR
ncbi:MAG: caspase family protein, partial [Paracoccaceae bacterium]|nr:caspase family protein [Paracoccaceae bacterium]